MYSDDPEVRHVAWSSLVIVFALVACLLASYIIAAYRVHRVPESAMYMLVGIVIGLIAIVFKKENSDDFVFDPRVFYFLLLPPISLQAGYRLRRKSVFRNLTTTFMFAVGGTIVSTLIIGFGIYLLSHKGALDDIKNISLLSALAYGLLISAIDIVPALSLVASPENNCGPILHQVMYGETINDVVAIAMFDTLMGYSTDDFEYFDLLSVFGLFVGRAIGGVAIGSVVAFICSFAFKHTRLDEHPAMEVIGIVIFAFCSYVLAQVAYMSPIISVFVCGLTLQHYNWYNISEEARHTTEHGLSALALMTETAIFIYLGLQTALSWSTTSTYTWSFPVIGSTILFAVFARAVHIFFFSNMLNIGRKKVISFRMQVFLFLVGLRGATSFALSLNLTQEYQDVLIASTMGVVIASYIFIGPFMNSFIRILQLKGRAVPTDAPLLDPVSLVSVEHEPSKSEQSLNGPSPTPRREQLEMENENATVGGLHLLWKNFDDNYLKPLFGGPLEDRAADLAESYGGHDIQQI